MKHQLTPADILAPDAYERVRNEKRTAIMAMKKKRRVAVGPYATFYFENYDTMWLQVQEMLRAEKGGEAQLADELKAYNPLIPNGQELVATVMFEITDPVRRQEILGAIGGVQNEMQLRVGHAVIAAKPEEDLDYTSSEGKASSVQFVHFPFTREQVISFRNREIEVMLAITHKHYGHMAVLPSEIREELANDFLLPETKEKI